jgi:hypothetical protein
MPQSRSSDQESKTQKVHQLPTEIELFIEPDGTVVFADLAVDAIPIAHRLTTKRGTMFKSLIQAFQDGLAVLPLRWQISHLKLSSYSRLADSLRDSLTTIRSLERSVGRLNRQINESAAQIAKLEHEKEALESGRPKATPSVRDAQRAAFRHLRPIAAQLPTLRKSIEEGENISTKDILELLIPLDDTLDEMGFRSIGAPGELVKFDPEHHRTVGKGARSIKLGDTVKILFIGHTHGGDVVYKAQVTHIDNE